MCNSFHTVHCARDDSFAMAPTPRSDSAQGLTFGVLGISLAFLSVVIGALQYLKMRQEHSNNIYELADTSSTVTLSSSRREAYFSSSQNDHDTSIDNEDPERTEVETEERDNGEIEE